MHNATLLLSAVLFAALLPATARAIEEPRHTVVLKRDAFELREYAPYVVAEVVQPEGGDDNRAFRLLFNYISGKNSGRQDIAMTAPVFTPKPERVAMTAPVTTRRLAEGVVMQFVLPASYTLETAPRPADPAVRLRGVPGGRVATWRFSGTTSGKNVREKLALLQAAAAQAGVTLEGEPVVARYNAPFVPPFLRRNELWVNVRP